MMDFIKRRWRELLIVVTISAGCLYWFSWHWKPFTQNAFVFADTRPVSPPVEGFITEIHVKNNQFVRKGDPLFTVFREPYRLNRAALENEVRAKQAEHLALQAEIRSQEAEILRCQAELANNRYLADRARKMYGAEAVSQAYAEERCRAGEASEAKVEAVRQKTEALKYRCSQVKSQIAALQQRLELSRILLELSVVRALADGWVTNLTLTPGGCYKPGDVLCGFIAAGSWRVQANFKESELSEIAEGMSARIWLRQYPGRLYHGVVESTGWGAERRKMSRETGLPSVRKENEWFLLPQRFPVQIRILDPDQGPVLHHGASAYVEIDTPSRPVRQFFWEIFLWH